MVTLPYTQPTYLPIQQPTYISTYPATYLPAYKPIYLPPQSPTYQHTNPSIYLPSHLPTCVPTYQHSYLPTYLHPYLPTYLPTNTYITLLGSFLSYPTLPFLVPIEVCFGMSCSLFRSVSVHTEVRFRTHRSQFLYFRRSVSVWFVPVSCDTVKRPYLIY